MLHQPSHSLKFPLLGTKMKPFDRRDLSSETNRKAIVVARVTMALADLAQEGTWGRGGVGRLLMRRQSSNF